MKTETSVEFVPENLNRWSLPNCYAGATWENYYRSGCGQSRDSGALERANFYAMLKAIGGEKMSDAGISLVQVVRENHWAVGWVEWIAIHESNSDALRIADKIAAGLEDYPVVDEFLYSEYEQKDADETWRNCYRPSERVEYIREHRGQFEFRSLSDMLGCIRGNYFAGYASELLN